MQTLPLHDPFLSLIYDANDMAWSLKDRIRSLIRRHFKKHRKGKSSAAPSIAERIEVPTPQQVTSDSQQIPILWRPNETQESQDQKQSGPKVYNRAAVSNQAATITGTLNIVLENQTSSRNVYAYITGRAIDNNSALFILQSDAKTPYYPSSPSTVSTKITTPIAIQLGAPGSTVTATIPRLAGARIWFSQDAPLTFLLNPGPGLVEPSVFNPSDPNYNVNFGFCEFTFNSSQVFVNISYVDFVSGVPIALTLNDTSGGSQHVGGMRPNGLAQVCQGLRDQTAKDGRRWSSLIVQSGGRDLRALSPNSGITMNPDWFSTYWTDYVNQVFAQYTNQPLIVDTQAAWGEVQGKVNSNGYLDFGDGSVFAKPNAKDIFGQDTGPFATGGNAKTNAIIPRIATGFTRSTLLLSNQAPNGVQPSQYYTNPTTNHYARVVHAANVDGLGYSFPYDDVTPDGGKPQEGAIYSFSPSRLTVTCGGNGAYAA
ncbi:Glucan endo-1,3-beta-glucosidase [Pseudocercospora fuligena]|uniref:Glucan endo-1,3-beta-glucosidase n=1 Tax=Pseudocercospora fuligena TaxID=685502 RepID=A0A8H6R9L7_9PEZI|nr:Glucan endo-1,3-beta-glucosidase [Pseudocercospora fuligena]